MRRWTTAALPAILISLSSLVATAAPAGAAPLDLTRVSERCRAVAEIPSSARIAGPAFSARVSAATCVADAALGNVPLSDTDASIQALEAAAAPIMATLDEVATRGDPKWQIIAEYWRGNLLFGMNARVRSTIPPVTQDMPLEQVSEIEARHQALDAKLERWAADATAAFRRVSELSRAHPQVASANTVLRYMVSNAEYITGLFDVAP